LIIVSADSEAALAGMARACDNTELRRQPFIRISGATTLGIMEAQNERLTP